MISLEALNDLEFAASALLRACAKIRKEVEEPIQSDSVKEIIERVAKFYGVTPDQILSRDRTADVAEARQVAMFIALPLSTSTGLGRLFKRDHGTVIYAKNTVKNRLSVDAKFRAIVEKLTQNT